MNAVLRRRLRGLAPSEPSAQPNDANLRVLIVQQRGDTSEAKVVSTLISAMQLDARSTESTAITMMQYGREYQAHGEQLRTVHGVDVISIDIGGTLGTAQPRWRKVGYLSRLALSLPRIVARVRSFQPDLIYSSQQKWDMRLAILLATMFQRPHVVHLHYLPGPWLGRDIGWWLKRRQHVICVSEFIRLKAIEAGVRSDRTTVIRNALPPEAIATSMSRIEARVALCNALQIPLTDVLVGMVARLAPGKGQLELVRAMAPLLTTEDATCRLVLVGSETYPELCYAQHVLDAVQAEGIAARVHWLGARSDVPELLHSFDVFAHPSFDEPCGLSVIEALLAGLPTIVWRDGGPSELVVDGETGILVETGNIKALTSALETLCQDAALRERMRQSSLASTARVGNTQGAARIFRETLLRAVGLSSGRYPTQ